MKKLYFLLFAFSFFTIAKAQVVNIPNEQFKILLLNVNPSQMIAKDLSGNYCSIDSNFDNKIQIDEAKNISYLNLPNQLFLRNLNGLANFTNLEYLDCLGINLDELDVNQLSKLKYLDCSHNRLTTLNISNLIFLENLDFSYNSIGPLDLSKAVLLKYLDCKNNYNLNKLDISYLVNLNYLDCAGTRITDLITSNVKKLKYLNTLSCPDLTSLDVSSLTKLDTLATSSRIINMKNGFKTNLFFNKYSYNLKYICVDNDRIEEVKKMLLRESYPYEINAYCSSNIGGDFFVLQGNTMFDNESNGCDTNDYFTKGIDYIIDSNNKKQQINTNQNKSFVVAVKEGTHTITPVLENPTYFNVSPTTLNITFPTQTSPFTQNFCITPNGVHPDLEIALLPVRPAVPGFDAKYKLVYKNKGNTTQSGAVNLTFNDGVLDVVVSNPVTSVQSTNTLSWNFTALQPFETREITFTMNVNSPMEIPAVINGDILNFVTKITSSAIDEMPADNTFTFNQTVVGSYDPNDKTCLEGSVITPSLIGQYVHYMIRFENKGTFAATNVVVKDMIDLSKFDISTLVPTSSSHSFITNITAGNKVEFIFENINLPFDDANNDGYIAFKIKTKPTLVVNDSFTNEANIYFDYNFPILTNKATSTFKTLGTPDFNFAKYFTLYPNPTKADLNITAKEAINVKSISVYNTLGQLVLVVTNADKVSKIDVSGLTSGNYFVKINSDKGNSNARFVKE